MSAIAWKETLYLRLWALRRIPLLAFTRPSVLSLDDSRCVIRIRLSRRTRNHLGSMYFAALAAGADCAGGLLAMRAIERSGRRVSLIFADFNAQFHRRAEGDVLFVNDDGERVRQFVDRVIASGQRENEQVMVRAYVPAQSADEPVATFTLTLSLKRKDI